MLPGYARVRHLPHTTFLHTSPNIAHSGNKPTNFTSPFTHSLQIFLILPRYFTPATSIFLKTPNLPLLRQMPKPSCHASPPQPHSEFSKACTNPHFSFYPSTTLHTSISPSYAPDYADFQLSSPMFQSQISTHSEHKLYISFPLYEIMDHRLSGWEITAWTRPEHTEKNLWHHSNDTIENYLFFTTRNDRKSKNRITKTNLTTPTIVHHDIIQTCKVIADEFIIAWCELHKLERWN